MINELNTLLARRYAQAFFNVYRQDMRDEHLPFIKKAVIFLRGHSTWSTFFDFSTARVDQQKQMIESLLKYFELPEVLEPLVALLCMHKRMILLPDVLEQFVRLFLTYNGVIEFTIASMPQLVDEQLRILVDFLQRKSDKKVRYTCMVDHQLIAGIRAKSSSLLWEYSIAKKLRESQQMALNGSNQ